MFEFITDEEERGQVGIGTLIVFIAMVLVAAIAAGVLINTAGLLQTQAEDTGQDSTDQVANNINVIGAVGSVASTSGKDTKYINDSGNVSDFDTSLTTEKVHTLRLTVQKSPGAADIDLSGLSIQYVGPESFANLVHHQKATAPEMAGSGANGDYITSAGDAAYYVETVTAESEDTVMTEESDRYEIIVPLQQAINESDSAGTLEGVDNTSTDGFDNSDIKLLPKGANVELTMTTDSGSQRYVNLRVPDSLVGDGGGTVQL